MARVKRGVTGHARHKKIVDAAKGYVGRSALRRSSYRPRPPSAPAKSCAITGTRGPGKCQPPFSFWCGTMTDKPNINEITKKYLDQTSVSVTADELDQVRLRALGKQGEL